MLQYIKNTAARWIHSFHSILIGIFQEILKFLGEPLLKSNIAKTFLTVKI